MMKNTDTLTRVQFETFLNVISNFQETFKFTHSEEFGLGQIFQNHFFMQNSSFWWKQQMKIHEWILRRLKLSVLFQKTAGNIKILTQNTCQ